jgi:sporulation protein YlmC with PRC-barrel domain
MRWLKLNTVMSAAALVMFASGLCLAQQTEPPRSPKQKQQAGPESKKPAERETGPAVEAATDEPVEQAEQRAQRGRGLTEQELTQRAADNGLIRARATVGKNLKDDDGQEVGTVRDYIIDTQRNQVALVIVSFGEQVDLGGPIRLGGQYVAVPFDQFSPAEDGNGLTTTVTKQQLEQANPFKSNQFPDFSSSQRVQQAYEAFGAEPYWMQGAEAEAGEGEPASLAVVRATKVLGKSARNDDNERLGKLQDMVIDTREGRIVYGVLAGGGVLGVGDRLTLVPYSALEYQKAQQQFVADATPQQIRARAFARNSWPDLTNEQWASQTHEQFGEQPYWQVFGYGSPTGQAAPQMQDATPRQMLEAAGLSQQQIDDLERNNYRRKQVRESLQQLYLDEGMSEQQARQKAKRKARRINQLRQQPQTE